MEKINPIIVIPTRLAATRLPNKPLRLIGGLPMIIQVVNRAKEADIAKILVAAADVEIAKVLSEEGVEVILTDKELQSGSDRISQALSLYDPSGKYNLVINLQGDLPTIEKQCLIDCIDILKAPNFHMSTVGVKISPDNEEDINNVNVVKAIVAFIGEEIGIARDFKRVVSIEEAKDCYHHIGIYGYRREALERFTKLQPSIRELSLKLEQLRALDNGMIIGFKASNSVPIGVDTEEDLKKADNYINSLKK